MFSNQYMGTRQITRGLPRTTSATIYTNQGPYSKMATTPFYPVNRQQPTQENQEEEEEVDYSFTNLSVRERRKLFAKDESPPRLRPAGVKSMTMPRQSFTARIPRSQVETQSEYGGDDAAFLYEPAVKPKWINRNQAAPTRDPRHSTSTASHLTWNRPQTRQYQPRPVSDWESQRLAYPHGVTRLVSPARSPQQPSPSVGRFVPVQAEIQLTNYQPQSSMPVRSQQPSWNDGFCRVVPNANTIIYPARRYSSVVHPSRMQNIQPAEQWRPLRVNVYSSEPHRTQLSPRPRTDDTWSHPSPVYPAYPAYVSRPQEYPDRFHRGTSVQPSVVLRVDTPKPIQPVHETSVQQTWKPMQFSTPAWENRSPRRQGRYISVAKTAAMQHRPQHPYEPIGVSDF